MDLKATGCERVEWTLEAQDRIHWGSVVNTVINVGVTYEGVSKSFRTGRLERELHMVQLSAVRCSYIAIL
jgi:hypothetical protein